MAGFTNEIKNERRFVRGYPMARLLPNMFTMFSLFCGMTAVRLALIGKFELAALSIVVASVFDVLDGRVARLLNSASKFGAELDSLADLTSFGIAPGLVLYLWALQSDTSGFGWIAVLVFASCCALRLARFNTMLEDLAAPKWTKGYFTGIPAPAGAGLALMPLFLTLAFGDELTPPAPALAAWMIVVGSLMVSRLPTLAMKGRRVSPILVAPIMACVCVLAAGLFTNTWKTLSLMSLVYLAMLPVGYISYRRREKMDLQGTEKE